MALKNVVELILRGKDEASKAFQSVDKSASRFQTTMSAVGRFMTGPLGLTAIGIGAAASLDRLIDNFVETGDRLDKLSKQLKLPVEFLSEMEYAAKISGVSFEQLAIAFRQGQKNIEDSLKGFGEAKQTIEEMGLSLRDTSGRVKSMDQLLPDLADKFAALDKEGRGTSEAMRLFGESGAVMLQFLRQGRGGLEALREEARKYGIITTENAEQAARLKDAQTNLKAALDGLAREALPPLLVGLTKLTNLMTQLADFDGTTVDVQLNINGEPIRNNFLLGGASPGGVIASNAKAAAERYVEEFNTVMSGSQVELGPFSGTTEQLEAALANAEDVIARWKAANAIEIPVEIALPPLGGAPTAGEVAARGEVTPGERSGRFQAVLRGSGPEFTNEALREQVELYRQLGEFVGPVMTEQDRQWQMQQEAVNNAKIAIDEYVSSSIQLSVVENAADSLAGALDGFAQPLKESRGFFAQFAGSVISDINRIIVRALVMRAVLSIPGLSNFAAVGNFIPSGGGRSPRTNRSVAFGSDFIEEQRRAIAYGGR